MDNLLYEALNDYKIKSQNIYEAVKFENYDELDELLTKRQNIIDNITSMSYAKEDFVQACVELNVVQMDDSINKLMSVRKEEIKNQIIHLKIGKLANNNYIHNSYKDSILLNKKY